MFKAIKNRSKFYSIAALSFVNLLGFTIFFPVLPFIVRDFGAPIWTYGLLLAAYPAAQFLAAPILGEMSDRLGRKPILILSQAGTLASWFVVAVSYAIGEIEGIHYIAPLGVLLLARVVDGATGGNIAVANAYLTDITPPKKRTEVFGWIGAVTGAAILVGPAIGSLAGSTRFGYLGVAVLAIVISTATFLAMYVFLEESLPESKRTKQDPAKQKKNINIYDRIRRLQTLPGGKAMLTLSAAFGVIMASYSSIIVLFIIDRFGLSQSEVGFFLLFVGTFLIFNQTVMVPAFTRRFGDLQTLVIGLSLVGVGFFAITITETLWMYTILYYILNLGLSLVMPTTKSLLSQSASEATQGEIMGIDESLKSASNAIVPVIMGFIYGIVAFRSFWIIGLMTFALLIVFFSSKSRMQMPRQKS